MKIVVAPDSFKECLSSREVSKSISRGIKKVLPLTTIVEIPISDGGEGLIDALVDSTGKTVLVTVKDPLLRNIQAEYGILEDGVTAVIEMAKASGLELLSEAEKNPMITSTYGTGQLILDALNKGCSKLIIGIGGSATNDGGVGMVQALGGHFLKKDGTEIDIGGGGLDELYSIDLTKFDQRVHNSLVLVACDVTNPLTGANGASQIYGAQKGGSQNELNLLDENLIHYAAIIRSQLHKDVERISGSGAAGGLGAALFVFLNAELRSGIDLIIETLDLEKYMENADLVITGEGKIDAQTLQGKTLLGIATLAKRHHVPVIAIAGKVDNDIENIYEAGITSIFSIVNEPMELKEAISNAASLIELTVQNIMKTFMIQQRDSTNNNDLQNPS